MHDAIMTINANFSLFKAGFLTKDKFKDILTKTLGVFKWDKTIKEAICLELSTEILDMLDSEKEDVK